MCTVHESKKKKFILFIPLIKKSFLSLTHFVPLSFSQIIQLSFTLQNHSQSVPLFLLQITPPLTNHPSSSSHPLDLAVQRPQITHRRSSLTVTLSLSRLSLLYWMGLIVRSDWRGLIVSWLCSDGFLWLCSDGFLWLWDRICGLVGRRCCGLWWGDDHCGFVVVRSVFWAVGVTVLWFVVGRRLLWIRGGHSVGLWRWGWDYGGVVVGLGLWRWAVLWVCFKWNRRRVQREREEQIEKWIIKKFRYIILSNGIYYFIVVIILFYCDVYIILLCWKLK